MKIIFAGTPVFAAETLSALIKAGHEIVLVLTQPDRPAGRGMKLQPSPVKFLAESQGIPVYQPNRLKDPETWEPIAASSADLMVVVAYGLILPQAVLDLPRLGCLNVHASLLPRWRGAAPIHRAIQAGDVESGVCIMRMDAGLDTGPVLSRVVVSLDPRETSSSLHDKLAVAGASLLCETLSKPLLPGEPQSKNGVTYAHKIEKPESHLSWQSNARELDQCIRAFNPFPGAAFEWRGEWVKVWESDLVSAEGKHGEPGEVLAVTDSELLVACGVGKLAVKMLQRPGGKRLAVKSFISGHAVLQGDYWK